MKLRVIFLSAFLAVFLLPFTSAQFYFQPDEVIRQAVYNFQQITIPFFEPVLNSSAYDEFFFSKILILFLLIFVIRVVLKRVPLFSDSKHGKIAWIVAVIVSILAVRSMSNDSFFLFVLIPYSVLGIAIATFIPFLIYFFFVHNAGSSGFVRRSAWALYAIVYIGLWWTRPDLGEARFIYWAGCIAVILMFIFDREIHRYFMFHEYKQFKGKAKNKSIAALQAEYLDILHVDSPAAKARRKDIEDSLRALGADVP